jgi:phosphoribosylglycinamide formyltransferase-1
MPPETPESVRLAVFASGKGSNFEKILSHFDSHPRIRVSLLVSNNKRAGALDIALLNRVESWVIGKEDLADGRQLARRLKKEKINYIILAGFLKKIPEAVIAAYPGRILNIHPALLPDFGGKGMYGSRVHEAVLSSGVKKSGITIHLVDEHYDNGDVIFQASCEIDDNENADSLAQKIHTLEHIHFPVEIEKFIEKQNHR